MRGRPTSGRGARRRLAGLAALSVLVALAAVPALGQEGLGAEQPDFWDLRLGAALSEQPSDFQEFACGTNGGPPSTPLSGFGDFRRCAAEPTGLHEVQFRYDDMLEYWARAMQAQALVDRVAGTRLFTFHAVLSVLIDDDGIVRGLRALTDNRVADRQRQLAFTLPLVARSRFGDDGWVCVDRPAAVGETPMAGRFVKQDCGKRAADGSTILTSARMLLREGQSLRDPANNQVRQGYFESTGRLEIFDPTVAVPLPAAEAP